mmetsp:Transcript_31906/g.67138  ORF Transcript_31906/g.67138 Transcript_31906/m.67138 type:complete len:242 (-) Transcript_31906:2170-2895(-)
MVAVVRVCPWQARCARANGRDRGDVPHVLLHTPPPVEGLGRDAERARDVAASPDTERRPVGVGHVPHLLVALNAPARLDQQAKRRVVLAEHLLEVQEHALVLVERAETETVAQHLRVQCIGHDRVCPGVAAIELASLVPQELVNGRSGSLERSVTRFGKLCIVDDGRSRERCCSLHREHVEHGVVSRRVVALQIETIVSGLQLEWHSQLLRHVHLPQRRPLRHRPQLLHERAISSPLPQLE